MRIALYNLTTTTRWGGLENFVWEVAAQMAERGHEVVVFGGRSRTKDKRRKTKDERRKAIARGARGTTLIDNPGTYAPGNDGGGRSPYVLRPSSFVDTKFRLSLFPYIDRDVWRKIPLLGRQYTLTKLLERLSMMPFALVPLLAGRFDVVHIQKPYDLPIGALAKLSGARLLFGCHGKDFWPADRLFARFADGSVSASRYNASQVRARYGINPVVVYNGVDLTLFQPEGENDAAVLEEYGLSVSPGQSGLLYAGRLVRWKGVEYVIRAMLHVRPEGTHLWVAGEGPYEEALRAVAKETGVQDRVHFLGKVEQAELAALYRTCACLVATSFVNETFGMALCEAMACGAPVVASDFGGFREVVEDGVTGLLAKPQDPLDLARKINVLLADPTLAYNMGHAGRERVLSLFSWRAVADRLEEVYRCLVPSST